MTRKLHPEAPPGPPVVSRARSGRASFSALVVFAIAWFGLVAASASLTSYPLVLSDEANYLLPTLFGYRAENYARWAIIPQIPNLLYYRIYAALAGTDPFLSAKVLNAAFVALAAVPAYATARLYLKPLEAAAFGAVVICAPMATFARHFMPECPYYFGFWCVVCALLYSRRLPAFTAALAAGSALGLLSLVKPHALALVIGAAFFLLLRPSRVAERWLSAAILAACFYAVRVAAAFWLSGVRDLSLSGPAYGGTFSLLRVVPGPFFLNAAGHLASLVLLGGVPLLTVGIVLIRDRRVADPALRDLILLALATLVAMLAMTVTFSLAAYLSDPEGERITRLHGRYYAYALPLTMLAYVAAVRRHGGSALLESKVGRVASILAMAVAACVVTGAYETSTVDYPELGILVRWPGGALILTLSAVAGFAALQWIRGGRLAGAVVRQGWPVAWWAVVVVSTSVLLLAAPLTGRWLGPNDVDRAMMADPVLRHLRGRDDGLVVGTKASGPDTYRVMFHLASLARGRFVARGASLDAGEIPGDVRWLILLPGVEFSEAAERHTIGPLVYVGLRQDFLRPALDSRRNAIP